jgi:uncharacterized membrane protein
MVDESRLRVVADIFADVIDLSEVERAAFLDRACDTDVALRAEVESLLEIFPFAEEYFRRSRSRDEQE